jgi:DNA topoisomerase-1
VYLIDKTGFRPGSDSETGGDVKAYGATTLEADHVKIDGKKVSFDFIGKKGVRITKTLEDDRLAMLLRPRVSKGGRLFSVSDGQVRDYLHSRDGAFKLKDFRTHNGTAKALDAMKRMPKPKSLTAFKKAQRMVAKVVSEHLGNTPAVALKSYIDPGVWSPWKTRLKT